MLIERGKYLTWISFPDRETLQPAWRKGYLQCQQRRWLWSHIRQEFLTYQVALNRTPNERWASYAKKLRQHIRRAEAEGILIERDLDPSAVITLFEPIAKQKSLNPISIGNFVNRPGLLITRARHPEWGILAAHAYQLDADTGIVKGLYNASAFRQFADNKPVAKLCSYANAYLYHADFCHFQTAGFRVYDFSGHGPESTGVNFFKSRFRGQLVQQYHYTPIWYFCLRWLVKKLPFGK